MPDGLPIDGYTPSQRRIIVTYEHFRFRPNGLPLSRRIAQELGYKLDVNNSSSHVRRVLKKYLKTRK
jgi:hypothetical protein